MKKKPNFDKSRQKGDNKMNIVLENGEKINLTLNFGRLLQLKKENKPIYEKYNKVLANGAKDVIEDTGLKETTDANGNDVYYSEDHEIANKQGFEKGYCKPKRLE